MPKIYLIYYDTNGVLCDIWVFLDAEDISIQKILMKCKHVSAGDRYDIYYRKDDDSMLEKWCTITI